MPLIITSNSILHNDRKKAHGRAWMRRSRHSALNYSIMCGGMGGGGGGGELVSPDAYRKSRCSLHEVNKYGRRGKERGRDEDREGNEGGE